MKNRREFLTAAGSGMALATLAGCASLGGGASKGKVVVNGRDVSTDIRSPEVSGRLSPDCQPTAVISTMPSPDHSA